MFLLLTQTFLFSAFVVALAAGLTAAGFGVGAERLGRLFSATLATALALGATTAIVETRGLTVMWGFFPIVVMLLGRRESPSRLPLGAWGLTAGLVLAGSLWFTFSARDGESGLVTARIADDVTYARLANRVATAGVESNDARLGTWSDERLQPTPYHWLDVWWQVAAMKLTGASALAARLDVARTLTWVLTLLGFAAILQRSRKTKSELVLVSLGALATLVSAAGLPWLARVHTLLENVNAYDGYYPLLIGTKFAFFFPLLLAAGLALLEERDTTTGLLVGALTLSAISTIASVLGALTGLLFVLVWRGERRRALRLTIAGLAPLLFVAIFYKVSGAPSDVSLRTALPSAQAADLVARAKPITLYLIHRGLGLTPWAVLLFAAGARVEWRERLRHPLTWAVSGAIVSGALAWFLVWPHPDSIQFFNNVEAPVLHVLFAAGVLSHLARDEAKWPVRVAAGFVFALVLVRDARTNAEPSQFAVSRPFHDAVTSAVAKLPAASRGGTLDGRPERLTARLDALGQRRLYPADFVGFYPDNAVTAHFLLEIDARQQPTYLGVAALEPLAERDPILAAFRGRTPPCSGRARCASPVEFVQEQKLRFVLAERDATIPDDLAALLGAPLTDARSGIRYYPVK